VHLRLIFASAALSALTIVMSAQSTSMTIVLTGQSMLRSDLRATSRQLYPRSRRS
jgi:hypothetical protein